MRSETIRWPWLIAGVMLIAGPAAADETEPSPAAPQAKYRLALMDVEPAAGSQQAAALALAALREVAAADERFDLAADEDLARARALWGKGVMVLTPEGLIDSDALANNTMNHTQACAIGHTAGAARLLMVSGYALELAPMGAAAGAPAMRQVADAEVTPGVMLDARLTATLTVVEIETCKVRERPVVSAGRGSSTSAEEAVAGARADFARSASEALEGLLPVHAGVRTVSRHGGEMNRGASDGVRAGQYFEVQRDARAIGHVYVDDVATDTAQVSLVHGVSRLAPGDRLVEGKAVREFEVGATLTPNVLSRTRADDVFGVAVGAQLMTYRPVGSNMYVVSFERLGLPGFSRIRGGMEIGRQVRIVPRRLFGYARVGLGAVRGQQAVRDSAGVKIDRGMLLGLELLNAVGVKTVFGDGLVVHLSASMPVRLYREAWYLESWDNKIEVPEDMVVYPSPFRYLPTLTLGLGWRF